MRTFFAALKFTMCVMASIIMLSSGAYLGFAFYFTDQIIHTTFAFVSPLLILAAFAVGFLAVEEIKQEIY